MSEKKKSNVQVLENDYSKKQYAKYAQQQRQIVFRRRRLFVIFAVAFTIFASVGISLFNDYLHLQNLQDVKEETIARDQEIKQQLGDLTREVALLEDEDYVAKVARSRFLYSKEGELVFPILNDDSANEETTDATDEESETASE